LGDGTGDEDGIVISAIDMDNDVVSGRSAAVPIAELDGVGESEAFVVSEVIEVLST